MSRKKTIIVTVVIGVLLAVSATHLYFRDRGRFTTEPVYSGLARSVSANDLLSNADPAATLRFGSAFRHLGGQKFVLYGVADTEQHFFIETTPDDKLKSLYWVQYEAYLPGKPYRYDYEDSPLRVRLGDYEFYTDTAVVQSNPKKRRRGTDGSMARQFVRSKGYEFPQDFSYSRLVYLTDESHQKELMIIFIEDLAPLGLTAPQLEPGGDSQERWPAIEQAHLDKIRGTLEVLPR